MEERAVIAFARFALLILISSCGGGEPAAGGMDAGVIDAAPRDVGSAPVDAGAGSDAMPVDRCAGVSCNAPPAAACVGAVQRTYDPIGSCVDGTCEYTPHDTPCEDGCQSAACVDLCAGVTCTNPPPPSCDGDRLRTSASPGTCSHGRCSYASSEESCELGCQDSTCFHLDPRLEDPTRVSFPFECQGTPLDAAQIIEHIAQGDDTIAVHNDFQPAEQAFLLHVYKAFRTCHPLTGCTAWSLGVGPFSDPYSQLLWVSGSGDLQLIQDDVIVRPFGTTRTQIEATIGTGDLQVLFNDSIRGGKLRRYKVRITRTDDGHGCFSAAGESGQDPPVADGSHLEWFYLGTAPLLPPVPRTTPAPLSPWPSQCQGTAAPDAVIASWFQPGATRIPFTLSTGASRGSTQRCHPITGCTPWFSASGSGSELFGLQTTPVGFALRLDFEVSVPIAGGLIDASLASGAYTGLVTTDKCVSYHRITTRSTPPSAVVLTTHSEEQNTAP